MTIFDIFKKRISAEDMGYVIYMLIVNEWVPILAKTIITSQKDKGKDPDALPGYPIFEIEFGLLAAAWLAIAEQYEDSQVSRILDGTHTAFIDHMKQMPINESEFKHIATLRTQRLREYMECLTSSLDSSKVMMELGKRFYWNIIGHEDPDLFLTTTVAATFTTTLEGVRRALKTYRVS